MRALAHCRRPVRAVIAGDGPDARPAARARRASSGVGERVELPGRVDDERLVELYAGALAVFYAPFDEDYGYVTVEAFRSERPVVTTADSGGVLEFVRDGENGFVVRAGRRRARSPRALDRLFDDRERARAARPRRRASACAAIGWDHVIEALSGDRAPPRRATPCDSPTSSPFPPAHAPASPTTARELAAASGRRGARPRALPRGPRRARGPRALERFRRRPVRELPAAASALRPRALPPRQQPAAPRRRCSQALLELPGVVVLHEYMLHHLVRELTLGARRPRGLRRGDALRGGRDRPAAPRSACSTPTTRSTSGRYPLFERVVDRSRAVARALRVRAPRACWRAGRGPGSDGAVPGRARRDRTARIASTRAARRARTSPPAAFVVASFGFVTPQKRLDPALAAFARLRAERPAGALPGRRRGLAALRLRGGARRGRRARASRSPAGWRSSGSAPR